MGYLATKKTGKTRDHNVLKKRRPHSNPNDLKSQGDKKPLRGEKKLCPTTSPSKQNAETEGRKQLVENKRKPHQLGHAQPQVKKEKSNDCFISRP